MNISSHLTRTAFSNKNDFKVWNSAILSELRTSFLGWRTANIDKRSFADPSDTSLVVPISIKTEHFFSFQRYRPRKSVYLATPQEFALQWELRTSFLGRRTANIDKRSFADPSDTSLVVPISIKTEHFFSFQRYRPRKSVYLAPPQEFALQCFFLIFDFQNAENLSHCSLPKIFAISAAEFPKWVLFKNWFR